MDVALAAKHVSDAILEEHGIGGWGGGKGEESPIVSDLPTSTRPIYPPKYNEASNAELAITSRSRAR